MKLIASCLVFCLCISLFPLGDGGRILFITPICPKSHKIFYMGIVEALAKRGHEVTMVSTFEPSKEIKNVREVVIQNFSAESFLENVFEEKDTITPLFSLTPKICADGLGQKHIQDLKNEEFDLIILSAFFSFCYLSFVHHLKIPFIYAFPGGLFGPLHDVVGNIDFPSISGNTLLQQHFPYSFSDRLWITLSNTGYKVMSYYVLEPRMYTECLERGLCPPDMPTFSEMNNNASLIIINSVKTLDWPPRPTMPTVIYAGGAHIKAPKKLPKELQKWADESGEDGFIFFSLGSAVNPDFLPERYRKILVDVFGSLKQRVLWKWNQETMVDLPKNVKLQKWLPQPDLLAHPKIKLFITHGGVLSTMEALYRGVPVIGMPVYADQHSNMKSIQREGWGRVIEWEKLEEKVFKNMIHEMLSNEKATEIVKRKSAIIQDKLVPPDEEAAYWIEYVIRHNGAPHLMSPLKLMSWYEVYNMDVWTFILLVTLAVLNILWYLIRFFFRKCFGIGNSKINKKKKE